MLLQVFPPFRIVEFEILFGSGINKLGCLVDAAEALEVVERKGSWYSYGDVKLGQGRKQAIEFLVKDPVMLTELEDTVKKILINKLPTKLGLSDDSSLDEESVMDDDLD